MQKLIDISGHTYNGVKIISFIHVNGKVQWQCLCHCGKSFTVSRSIHLRKGLIKSCGCARERVKKIGANRTHGESKNNITEYLTWRGLIDRCTNKKSKFYHNYGGIGISVCDRWLNSYSNFLDDMGRKPSSDHSIDRINNNGNYEPSNCRWATRKEQSINKRTTLFVNFSGARIPFLIFCEQNGLNYDRAYPLLRKGKSPIEILSTLIRTVCICSFLLLVISCSPEFKLRKAKKLIAQAEAAGLTWSVDTVFHELHDTIRAVKVDTIVRVESWADTIVVTKDRVTTRVVVNPSEKVVYISSKCDSVVITRKVPVYVTKTINAGPSTWDRIKWFLIGFAIGVVACGAFMIGRR